MLNAEIWLRMSMVKGLNTAQRMKVGEYLQGYADIHPDMLMAGGLNQKQCQQFISPLNEKYINATLTWLEKDAHHLLVYGDSDYPKQLTYISSAPLLLFAIGDISTLSQEQIAMVGSRNFSHYGERWAKYFTKELVQTGLIITSGLAIGIDSICHQSALNSKGKTIAVLGSGLENIYPRRHCDLAKRITEEGGAIVSEFLTTALPLATHFPKRNRIISGLSAAVVVVEASLRSGSLITARYALEQGRDVFSLPGPLGSPTSEGTHWLIQQGAYLVNKPQDIIEQIRSSLKWLPMSRSASVAFTQSESSLELSFPALLSSIEYEATPVDLIAQRTNQPVSQILIQLLDLELEGWVSSVNGGYIRLK